MIASSRSSEFLTRKLRSGLQSVDSGCIPITTTSAGESPSNLRAIIRSAKPIPLKETGLATRMELSALDMAAQAIAHAEQARQKADLDALERAIAKRYEEDAAKLRERHEAELRAKEVELDRQIARDVAYLVSIQDEQKEAFLQSRKESRTGWQGFMDAIESRWNPNLATEKAKAREQARQNFYRRLAKERADYEVLLQQNKQLEIENLVERQRFQRDALKTKAAEDRERHIREFHESERIKAEIQAARREEEKLERNDSLGDGPPPPELGKS